MRMSVWMNRCSISADWCTRATRPPQRSHTLSMLAWDQQAIYSVLPASVWQALVSLAVMLLRCYFSWRQHPSPGKQDFQMMWLVRTRQCLGTGLRRTMLRSWPRLCRSVRLCCRRQHTASCRWKWLAPALLRLSLAQTWIRISILLALRSFWMPSVYHAQHNGLLHFHEHQSLHTTTPPVHPLGEQVKKLVVPATASPCS